MTHNNNTNTLDQKLTALNTYQITVKQVNKAPKHKAIIKAYRPDTAEYLALLEVSHTTGIDTEYLETTNIIKL